MNKTAVWIKTNAAFRERPEEFDEGSVGNALNLQVDGIAGHVARTLARVSARRSVAAHDVNHATAKVVGDSGKKLNQSRRGRMRVAGAPIPQELGQSTHRGATRPTVSAQQTETHAFARRDSVERHDPRISRSPPTFRSLVAFLARSVSGKKQALARSDTSVSA